jgi:Glu-tRNA(Gln) amidotransferase subunit E-like FAD-binding protein
MTHSDLGVESLSGLEWNQLSKALGADSGDAIMVVWAPEDDAETAAREILIRAREALHGIPAETRQGFPDGTTGFERILPGADRMYPDTDTPPLPIPDSTIEAVRSQMGETPWDRQERYEGMEVESCMAARLAVAPWAHLFDSLAPSPGPVAQCVAGVLEKWFPHHLRRCGHPRRPAWGEGPLDVTEMAQRLDPLVRALEVGDLLPNAFAWAVDMALEPASGDPGFALERFRIRPEDKDEWPVAVQEVVARAREMKGRDPQALLRWAIGEVMRRFPGRLDPLEVSAALVMGIWDDQEEVAS